MEMATPLQSSSSQPAPVVDFLVTSYVTKVSTLEDSIQALKRLSREAAIRLSFVHIQRNSSQPEELSPSLLTEIENSAKLERDRHLHNIKVLRFRATEKKKQDELGVRNATAKATELITQLLNEGLVEKREKVGVFIKAFVAGFVARQRSCHNGENASPLDPGPLLRAHLRYSRGEKTSSADTALASKAFMRGFEESTMFNESGGLEKNTPILMGIIDVSDSKGKADITESAATKEKQLPLLILQVDRTLDDVDRTLQMINHALAIERLRGDVHSPIAHFGDELGSKGAEECQKRTPHSLTTQGNDADEHRGSELYKDQQNVSYSDNGVAIVKNAAKEGAYNVSNKTQGTLNEEKRILLGAARAKDRVYETQTIANVPNVQSSQSLSPSKAIVVTSEAIMRAKKIGIMAKSFDPELSNKIQHVLEKTSPPVPNLAQYHALDEYRNSSVASRQQFGADLDQTRVGETEQSVLPSPSATLRNLGPSDPSNRVGMLNDQTLNDFEETRYSKKEFMLTTASFESRRKKSTIRKTRKDREYRHATTRNTNLAKTNYATTRTAKKIAWRGGGASLGRDSTTKQCEESRAAARIAAEKEKRNILAERARARQRKRRGIPSTPISPNQSANPRAQMVEQVEAAERLHRQPSNVNNALRDDDPLREAFRDLARADQNAGHHSYSQVGTFNAEKHQNHEIGILQGLT